MSLAHDKWVSARSFIQFSYTLPSLPCSSSTSKRLHEYKEPYTNAQLICDQLIVLFIHEHATKHSYYDQLIVYPTHWKLSMNVHDSGKFCNSISCLFTNNKYSSHNTTTHLIDHDALEWTKWTNLKWTANCIALNSEPLSKTRTNWMKWVFAAITNKHLETILFSSRLAMIGQCEDWVLSVSSIMDWWSVIEELCCTKADRLVVPGLEKVGVLVRALTDHCVWRKGEKIDTSAFNWIELFLNHIFY